MEMPAGKLEQFLQIYPTAASLNQAIGQMNEEDGLLLEDIVSSKNICPIKTTENRQIKNVVRKIMKEKLSEMEIQIISLKDGLETGIGIDFSEIGKILGFRTEKVRQIYNIALRKIRPKLEAFNH